MFMKIGMRITHYDNKLTGILKKWRGEKNFINIFTNRNKAVINYYTVCVYFFLLFFIDLFFLLISIFKLS